MYSLTRAIITFFILLLLVCPLCGQAVVVLPFFNQSESANFGWIGESIAESLREALASQGVLVLDRDSREKAYRRLGLRPTAQITLASIIKVAEVLDASSVVYGQFAVLPPGDQTGQSKGHLVITAQNLDLVAVRQHQEIVVSGPLENLTGLQDNLAWQLLQDLLRPEQAPPHDKFFENRAPTRLDAMEAYIRGLLAKDLEQRHRYFTLAARLDPNFSPPCFELGKMRWNRKDYGIAASWFERVRPTDTHYRAALFFLGLCRYQTGDYVQAEKAFKTVLESVPVSEVWNNLGAAQSRLNLPAARESFQKALEGDPNDPVYHFNLGYVLWKKEQFDEAAEQFQAVLDRLPDDKIASAMLARCQQKAGPLKGETRMKALERLKVDLNELAYLQLKAMLNQKSR